RYLVIWDGASAPGDYTVRTYPLSAAGAEAPLVLERVSNTDFPSVAIESNGAGRTLVLYEVPPPSGYYERKRVRARFIDYNIAPSCTLGSDCPTGFCADGVCCDSACGGSDPGDCQACSVAAGAARNGVCGQALIGTVCRPAAGVCDLPEVCDGL